jgi:hypothetical protein
LTTGSFGRAANAHERSDQEGGRKLLAGRAVLVLSAFDKRGKQSDT